MIALMLLAQKTRGRFQQDLEKAVKALSNNATVNEATFFEHVRQGLVNAFGSAIRAEDGSIFEALMDAMRTKLLQPEPKGKDEVVDMVASRMERDFNLWEFVERLWEKDDDNVAQGYVGISGHKQAEAFIKAMPPTLQGVMKADDDTYKNIQETLRVAKAKMNIVAHLATTGQTSMAASRQRRTTRRSRSRSPLSSGSDTNGSGDEHEVYMNEDGENMMGSFARKKLRSRTSNRSDDEGSNRRKNRNKRGSNGRRPAAAAKQTYDRNHSDDEDDVNTSRKVMQAAAAVFGREGKGKCFKCGEEGHWMNNCPKVTPTVYTGIPPPPYPPMPFPGTQATPYQQQQGGNNWNQSGNDNGQRNFTGQRKCYNCNEVGHLKRDCPTLVKKKVSFDNSTAGRPNRYQSK